MKIVAYNRIKEVLKKKKVSQEDLAEKLDMNKSSISRWCNQKQQPPIDTLFEVAKVLNVDVCKLLNKDAIK